MKILVVDDEEDFVSVLIEALHPDHEVVGLHGGANAVTWTQKNKFDLVLVDLRLPDGNGLTLVSALKKACPHVGLILMTGTVDPQIGLQAAAAGADAFLTKPINIPYLRKLMCKLTPLGAMQH